MRAEQRSGHEERDAHEPDHLPSHHVWATSLSFAPPNVPTKASQNPTPPIKPRYSFQTSALTLPTARVSSSTSLRGLRSSAGVAFLFCAPPASPSAPAAAAAAETSSAAPPGLSICGSESLSSSSSSDPTSLADVTSALLAGVPSRLLCATTCANVLLRSLAGPAAGVTAAAAEARLACLGLGLEGAAGRETVSLGLVGDEGRASSAAAAPPSPPAMALKPSDSMNSAPVPWKATRPLASWTCERAEGASQWRERRGGSEVRERRTT